MAPFPQCGKRQAFPLLACNLSPARGVGVSVKPAFLVAGGSVLRVGFGSVLLLSASCRRPSDLLLGEAAPGDSHPRSQTDGIIKNKAGV